MRYIESRGELVKVEPDATGDFYVHLAAATAIQIGSHGPMADRVILRMSVDRSAAIRIAASPHGWPPYRNRRRHPLASAIEQRRTGLRHHSDRQPA